MADENTPKPAIPLKDGAGSPEPESNLTTDAEGASSGTGGVSFEPSPALETATGATSEGDVSFSADPALEQGSKSAGGGSTGGASAGFAQTLKDQANKLTQQATDRARSFAGDNKDRATGALDDFSQMMRDAAATVDERLGQQYGQYARSAADQIAGFSDNLRGKEVDDLIEDAREFVKKSPAIAIGTAAALGFVMARLIKSGIDAAADVADRGDDASGRA